MKLIDAKKDHYRRLAHEQGYRSRASYKLKEINKSYRIIGPGSYVLDLGCGSGYICEKATTNKANAVVGIDIVRPAIFENIEKQSWDFLNINLDQVNWQNKLSNYGKFSLILAFDIIEHLYSPYLFLDSCKKILSKEGVLVVTTPNLMSWERYAWPVVGQGLEILSIKFYLVVIA